MSSLSDREVIDAFVDVVRTQLKEGHSVTVPGLGTLEVEHRSSQTGNEDEAALNPPRDVVTFVPEQ